MAEPIGIASGVAALATIAFQAGTTLYNNIQSYQSHQQTVQDLLEENGALNSVLSSISKTIASSTALRLSALEFPLKRCGEVCREFNDEINKLASLSGGRRERFISWARLRYMGEDIDGFRRLLAGYKIMINVALVDATLLVLSHPEFTLTFLTLVLFLYRQSSTLTHERIEGYAQMLQRATAGIDDRLDRIDGRLEILVDQTVASTGPEAAEAAAEVQQIQEERASTERYKQICAQLLEQIKQFRLAGRRDPGSSTASETDFVPERIANEGLDECTESLSRMASKLAAHEKHLFTRLAKAITGSGTSPRDEAEISRLRSEWESTHTQMEILTKAARKLEETVTVIQNRATGNAIQLLVSANNRPIQGTNVGTGKWTTQMGGYMNNESLQKVMGDMLQMTLATCEVEKAKTKAKEPTAGSDRDGESSDSSKFEDLYGEGYPLSSNPPPAPGTRDGSTG